MGCGKAKDDSGFRLPEDAALAYYLMPTFSWLPFSFRLSMCVHLSDSINRCQFSLPHVYGTTYLRYSDNNLLV